jgi:hypothetical protein
MLDFDDLQSSRACRARVAYGRSKLCNILFTCGLARDRLPVAAGAELKVLGKFPVEPDRF